MKNNKKDWDYEVCKTLFDWDGIYQYMPAGCEPFCLYGGT